MIADHGDPDRLAEDVRWLLDAHEWPPRIAHRTGYTTVDSLCRRLRQLGHRDLARELLAGMTRTDTRERGTP